MKIAVFAYDFPDWRSCTYVTRMVHAGIVPDVVIGAPRVQLDIRPSRHKTLSIIGERRVADVCEELDVPYLCMPHAEVRSGELGFIAAARILPRFLIESFSIGIVNLHPGLIPENRGLDNVQNAIARGLPQGVTAHFIDAAVDAGWVISRTPVAVLPNDSLTDIGDRLFRTMADLVVPTIRMIEDFGYDPIAVNRSSHPVNIAGDPGVDLLVEERFSDYVRSYAR